MSNSKKIIYEIEVTEHNEFGQCLKAVCPDCGTEIKQLAYMSSWNVLTCSCPKEWSFTLQAVGVPTQRAADASPQSPLKNKRQVASRR